MASENGSWLTFRTSEQEAYERAGWTVTEAPRVLVEVNFTSAGFGHYVLGGLLYNVARHPNSWRFVGDLPFHVRDTQGNVLVSTSLRCPIVASVPLR